MNNSIFQFFAAFAVSSIFIYVFGYLCVSAFTNSKGKGIDKSFLALLIGWTLFATIGATYATKANTIHFDALIILILYLLLIKRKEVSLERISLPRFRETVTFISFSILIFLANWGILHQLNLESLVYSTNDFAYYARLSDFLYSTGYESTSLDYINPLKHQKVPYHYIEHWYTGAISLIFHLSSTQTFPLIVIPQLLSILTYGFVRLFKASHHGTLLSWLLAFSALTVSGFAILYPNSIDFLHVYIHDWSIIAFVKLLPFYLFALAALFSLKNKNYIEASFWILYGGINYTTMLPAALVFSFSICLISLISDGKKKKQSIILGLIIFLSIALFVLRYGFQSAEYANSNLTGSQFVLSKEYLQTGINILVKLSFSIFVVLLPYTMVYVLLWKKSGMKFKAYLSNENVFPVFLLGALLSLLPYSLIHNIPNAHQLYRSMYFVCGNLAGIWIIQMCFMSKSKQIRILGITLIIANLFIHSYYIPQHETKTIKKGVLFAMENELQPFNGKAAYFRWKPENTSYYLTATDVFTPGKMLPLLKTPFQIYCLNPEVILEEPVEDFKDAIVHHFNISPITKYVASQSDSTEKSQIILAFLRENQINLLITPNDFELPIQLLNEFQLSSIHFNQEKWYTRIP